MTNGKNRTVVPFGSSKGLCRNRLSLRLSFPATSGGAGVEEVVGGVGYKRLMTDVI